MARRVRSSVLESRSMRLKLKVRKKPYAFTTIAPGIAIGYRRNKGPGTWVLRASNGHGGYWTDVIALADDHEDANNEVLTYWAAQDRARTLVRGKAAEDHRPITVAEAIDDYERDLAARGGLIANARYIRSLLPPTLLSKPVALLTAKELRRWRDGLRTTREASSVTRICKSVKAGLNLSAAHDVRITNQRAWQLGLAALPDSYVARRVELSKEDVHAIVAAAYAQDLALGLFVETAAITGARPSQLSRLEVNDLQDDRSDPRLMMPSSFKGKGKKRIERRSVPIPASLAVKLRQAVKGRRPHDPLLTQENGARWQHSNHVRRFRTVAAAAGLDVTLYALRHASIINMLLANVPARVVAVQHFTSVQMLERSYAAHLSDHSDGLVRRAMLDFDVPTADNVVTLSERRS